MDNRSPETRYTGRHENEFPDWVHDIGISYRAYKLVRSRADMQLGTPATIHAGELREKYDTKYDRAFVKLISQVKEQLPTAIQFRSGQAKNTSIDTRLGDVGLSANAYNLFYLPKTDEILRVKDGPGQAEYLPNNSEFVGWNMIRESIFGSDVIIYKIDHDLNHGAGIERLSTDDIRTIVNQIEESLKNKSGMPYIEEFRETEKSLQQEMKTAEGDTGTQLGFEIRRRIINLVNALSQYPDLFKQIPKIIVAGKRWERDPEGRVIVSEKQPYFRVEQRDLVLAPVKKTKNWRGKIETKPDFSQAVEASPGDWLHMGLLETQLLRPIPKEYREFMEDPEGYEFRHKSFEEKK